MPGANLTRVEAEERKSIVSAPISYHVQLDLTRDARTFGSTTTICFGAEPGSETFLDLIADNVTRKFGGMTAVEFTGTHYDMGNKLRVVEAQVELALQHPEIGEAFRAYLKEFCKTL